MAVALHKVVEDIESLPMEDQIYIRDIVNKIIIEARREEIRQSGEEAMQSYREGRSKRGSADDLMKDLLSDD